MAKKKRVTLPKNFKELVEAGEVEMLQAMYDQCELFASYDGRYGMNTALHCYGVPDALVRWLVAQGLDINIENYYGRSPLYQQTTIGSETVKLLFELGADIEKPDKYGDRSLHNAARYFQVDTLRFLADKGADIHAENEHGQTPLAVALAVCRNANIPQLAEIAAILLAAGATVTPDMLERVKEVGEDFEFHRAGLNPDFLAETEAGLQQLYTLFNVDPAPKRQMHDGISPIVVADGSWEQQYEALWELLVPSSGAAQTVQGEVVRITGRVRDELYRNGGVNWDKNYRKMLDALLKHFTTGTALSETELAEAKTLTTSIHGKGCADDGAAERLCALSVLWVLANPQPMPLSKVAYNR